MKQEERILNAAERLKLPRCASIRQIQKRYCELVKAHHPDWQKGTQGPEMPAINEAYGILMDYCHNYKIRFDEGQIEGEPRDWWMHQFGDNL